MFKKLLLLFSLILFPSSGFAASADQSLEGVDLKTHKPIRLQFADAKMGKVIIFLSTRCPCSASHEESLKQVFEEYHSKGFRFVGIHSNQDEPVAEAEAHFAQANLPFMVLQDKGASIANRLGALKTPHVYIIDPQGKILFQGGVDDSHNAQTAKKPFLKNALLQIKEGKRPNPEEVRVLGCVIKRA